MRFEDYDNMVKTMFSNVIIFDDDGNKKDVEINPEDQVYPRIQFSRTKVSRWEITYSIQIDTKFVEDMNQILEQVLTTQLKQISNESVKLIKNYFEKINDYCWKAEWVLDSIRFETKKWPTKDKDE